MMLCDTHRIQAGPPGAIGHLLGPDQRITAKYRVHMHINQKHISSVPPPGSFMTNPANKLKKKSLPVRRR
jgi:hypothetical protein